MEKTLRIISIMKNAVFTTPNVQVHTTPNYAYAQELVHRLQILLQIPQQFMHILQTAYANSTAVVR